MSGTGRQVTAVISNNGEPIRNIDHDDILLLNISFPNPSYYLIHIQTVMNHNNLNINKNLKGGKEMKLNVNVVRD